MTKKINPLQISIKGLKWTVKIMSTANYKKINGSDSRAITHLDTREIHIPVNFLCPQLIIHEIHHAMADSCLTEGASVKNLDEIGASILENHYPHYNMYVWDIFAHYIKEINR